MAAPRLDAGHVRAGRLDLHHVRGGSGPPLLLIHGLGSSGYLEWRFNLGHLAATHTVLAPDLPGFGRSPKPRTRYTIAYFARTLVRYLDALGIERAAVVGTSLGGRVALEMALEFPELVERLGLVSALGLGRPKVQFYYPLMMVPRVGETAMGVARSALERVPPAIIRRFAARYAGSSTDLARTMDDGYLADLREMYAEDGFVDAYLATVRELATPGALFGAHDLSARLASIRARTLIVWGTRDPLFPVEHARRAHALLRGSTLAVIDGAGHTPQAEYPAEFNAIVTGFLAA